MHSIFKSHHPARHAKSFKHAFEGILHALLNEANFRVQVVIVILAVIFGKLMHISSVEWALLTISMGSLLAAELINTTIEEIMDHFEKEENPVIRIIKDLSAGYVLITALTALLILYLIFGLRV